MALAMLAVARTPPSAAPLSAIFGAGQRKRVHTSRSRSTGLCTAATRRAAPHALAASLESPFFRFCAIPPPVSADPSAARFVPSF
eukprot:6190911-Pleurochrysis_carterae.AAC.3